MEKKVELYIKKLIGLGLIVFGTLYAIQYLPFEIIIPIALLIFSFTFSRITNKKPPYLFGMQKVDSFINRKGGFWTLFKLILSLFGFIYDILVWEVWSIYVVFEIIIDLIWLVKEIIFWIVHAIVWFLRLFVPPIVFLYKMFIHYIVKWFWWVYQLAFKNVTPSVKLNYFLISLWGSTIALFSIFVFYYLSVLVGAPSLLFIGIILAALPIAWSFGEISSINENNLQKEPYYEVTNNFENGFESVKYVLYYVVTFFVLFLVQILLDFLGWIPSVGLTFLGLTLNLNTLISLVMLFLFILILFANLIIPTHLLKTNEQETPFHDVLSFFKQILGKGLRYIVSIVPSFLFSIVLMVIPAIVVGLAIAFSFYLKNNVVEYRVNTLQNSDKSGLTAIEVYEVGKKIERLEYFYNFPNNIVIENITLEQTNTNIENILEDKESYNADQIRNEQEYSNRANTIREQRYQAQNEADIEMRNIRLRLIENQQNQLNNERTNTLQDIEFQIKKCDVDIKYLKSKKRNLPVAFFFVILWASLFGGLVLAIGTAYLGNVFYSLYTFKEDGKPTFYRNLINAIATKDKKQPLLGFTILVIVILITLWLLYQYDIVSFGT